MIFTKNKEAMELSMAEIDAKYDNPYFFVKPNDTDPRVPRFELSIPTLNHIFSNHYFGDRAGFAMGKVYNVFGPESIGKTAMCLYISSQIVKAGGIVHWIDKEHSWDHEYAKGIYGLDVYDGSGKISVSKPDSAEQAFNTIKSIVDNGAADLIVVDSVSALGTDNQNDKDAEGQSMAELARKLSEHFPRIMSKLGRHNISIIYINQLRANIVMGSAMGNKYTGGNAMKFYPHMALEMRRPKAFEIWNTDKTEYLGHSVLLEADKNKTSRPHIKGSLIFYPEEGFSRTMDIIELATNCGVITKGGAGWLTYGDQKYQGLENIRKAIKANPGLLEAIWESTKPLLEPTVNTTTGEIINVTPPEIVSDAITTSSEKKTRRKAS